MSPQAFPQLVLAAPGGQPTLRLVTGEASGCGELDRRETGESWSTDADNRRLAVADVLQPGDRLGRFIVRGVLGEGGMSVVYDAFDPELERGVALKRIKLRGAGGVEGPDDLIAEARALARLNHPNVVTIYDVVPGATGYLLALEKVEGTTLRAWLAERRRTEGEILAVFAEAAQGLHAAHAAGVVHRDFKPDNVLVGRDGRVRITDFGLARPAWTRAPLAVAGTPRYVAPEQAGGARPDPRSDQYSFAVALAEALLGWPESGPDVALVVPGTERLPRRLRTVLSRALAPCCDERYPSMAALSEALRRAREGDIRARSQRRKAIAGVVAGCLLVAAWFCGPAGGLAGRLLPTSGGGAGTPAATQVRVAPPSRG